LDYQNNFVETLKIMSNAAKNFDILAASFSVLHNYFNRSTKLLFWSIYSAKILNLSAKSFFRAELSGYTRETSRESYYIRDIYKKKRRVCSSYISK